MTPKTLREELEALTDKHWIGGYVVDFLHALEPLILTRERQAAERAYEIGFKTGCEVEFGGDSSLKEKVKQEHLKQYDQ